MPQWFKKIQCKVHLIIYGIEDRERQNCQGDPSIES